MNTKVHQIKIDFNVTEQIKRFVYVYIVEAESCYLIDSGVYGCKKQIIETRDGTATLEIYSAGNPQSPDYECGIWIPVQGMEEFHE